MPSHLEKHAEKLAMIQADGFTKEALGWPSGVNWQNTLDLFKKYPELLGLVGAAGGGAVGGLGALRTKERRKNILRRMMVGALAGGGLGLGAGLGGRAYKMFKESPSLPGEGSLFGVSEPDKALIAGSQKATEQYGGEGTGSWLGRKALQAGKGGVVGAGAGAGAYDASRGLYNFFVRPNYPARWREVQRAITEGGTKYPELKEEIGTFLADKGRKGHQWLMKGKAPTLEQLGGPEATKATRIADVAKRYRQAVSNIKETRPWWKGTMRGRGTWAGIGGLGTGLYAAVAGSDAAEKAKRLAAAQQGTHDYWKGVTESAQQAAQQAAEPDSGYSDMFGLMSR